MGGFFGAVSKQDCVLDIFFGVDYHSHLGTRRGGMMFGFTGNYRRVKVPYDAARVNTVCRVRLGKMDDSHDLEGDILG